ncbi:MAG: hypothetical protein DMF06_05560 [Verrucomicrobia bacterium]|nr:MAG: hypothetical protein DMF06_05560 [Verrucomicrobiota bacterium]
MGSFIQLSRYYFDDKDIADLFSHPAFTVRVLTQIAREQGVFLHRDESIDDLIGYLRRFAFDWATLIKIAKRINADERQEKRMPYRIALDLKPEQIIHALERTRDKRANLKRETYNFQQNPSGLIDVDIEYTHVDPTRMMAMQREQRHIQVEIENVGGKVEIHYNNNDRAVEVVEQFVSFVRASVDENLTATKIELRDIRDPVKRTEFFLELMHRMQGFRVTDVKDLKVDHRFPEAPSTNEDVQEEGEEQTEDINTLEGEQVKGLVRNAVLHGESLLTSELYRRLRETGYYIASSTWSAKEDKGEERIVEFTAGFSDPVAGTGFAFDVLKVVRIDKAGDRDRAASPFKLFERRRLQTQLAESCYAAYEKLKPAGAS